MKKPNIAAIIPARYASTRLPGKPLLDINGKSLIQRVWENIKESIHIDRVAIATDDERILSAVTAFGAECYMTSAGLPSGTDRIAAALKQMGGEYDIILNAQGDEPFLKADNIDRLITAFVQSSAGVGTLVKKITNQDDIHNPNVVKAVLDNNSNAMYFSRSPIPFVRDADKEEQFVRGIFYKHIGVYAYKKIALETFVSLPPSSLEILEKLEQLRLLQSGVSYLCVETGSELLGVDTPEDLERARAMTA